MTLRKIAGLVLCLSAAVSTLPACSSRTNQQETTSQSPPRPRQAEPRQGEAPDAGFLEVVDQSVIVGWAWDRNRPDQAVEVDIYDGDSLITTARAEKARKDLRDAGIGNGAHGFQLPIPSGLKDGKSHTIRAMVSGTKVELKNSPKKVEIH